MSKGFSATRVEDVARKAGISKAAIYLYFRNKDALLSELIECSIVPVIDDVQALAAQSQLSPQKAIISCIEKAAAKLSDPRAAAIPRVVLAEAALFPQIAAMYHRRVIQPGFNAIGLILQNGINRGIFRPVDIDAATRMILAPLLVHFVFEPLLCPGEGGGCETDIFVRNHADAVFHGLLAKGEPA